MIGVTRIPMKDCWYKGAVLGKECQGLGLMGVDKGFRAYGKPLPKPLRPECYWVRRLEDVETAP